MLERRPVDVSTYSPSSASGSILKSESPYLSRNDFSRSPTAISAPAGRFAPIALETSRFEPVEKKAAHTANWVVSHTELARKQSKGAIAAPPTRTFGRKYKRKQDRPRRSAPQLGGSPGVVFTVNLPRDDEEIVHSSAESANVRESGLMSRRCVAVVRNECAQVKRSRKRNRYDSESACSLRALDSQGSNTGWCEDGEINSTRYTCGIRRGTRDRKLIDRDVILESPRTCKQSRSLDGRQSGSTIATGDGIVKQCASCSTSNTPMWRDSSDGIPYCNACGIRYKKYGVRCGSCKYIPRKEEKSLHSCPRTGCDDNMNIQPSRAK